MSEEELGLAEALGSTAPTPQAVAQALAQFLSVLPGLPA